MRRQPVLNDLRFRSTVLRKAGAVAVMAATISRSRHDTVRHGLGLTHIGSQSWSRGGGAVDQPPRATDLPFCYVFVTPSPWLACLVDTCPLYCPKVLPRPGPKYQDGTTLQRRPASGSGSTERNEASSRRGRHRGVSSAHTRRSITCSRDDSSSGSHWPLVSPSSSRGRWLLVEIGPPTRSGCGAGRRHRHATGNSGRSQAGHLIRPVCRNSSSRW